MARKCLRLGVLEYPFSGRWAAEGNDTNRVPYTSIHLIAKHAFTDGVPLSNSPCFAAIIDHVGG